MARLAAARDTRDMRGCRCVGAMPARTPGGGPAR
jgi:hypothetical protein